MVTVTSTAATTTFGKAVCGPATSPFDTTSGTYVDVTGVSIASVPNNAKIYFNLYLQKLTTGTMNVRITDGTNVFWEETGLSVAAHGRSSLDGTVTQNSGGAATVKLQILTSDANAARVNNNAAGATWIACTDMTGGDPLVIAPTSTTAMTDAPFVFSGKRQVDTLFIMNPSRQQGGGLDDEFSVNVMGYNVEPLLTDATVVSNSFSPNVITSEIRVYPGHTGPIWAAPSTGRGAVIIAWTGFNIEVTG